MSPAPTVVSLALAAAVAVALPGAGARSRRLLRLPLPPALRLPADFVLGAWAAGSLTLALGVAGLLRWWSAMLVVAVLLATGRYRTLSQAWRDIALLAPTALVGLPLALAPPFFYDALVYHLGLPWQALMEGRWSAHPENLFSAFPPLAQAIYAVPLSFMADRAPALLHLASFLIAGAATAALARVLGAPRWAALLGGACLVVLPSHTSVPALPAAEGWAIAAALAGFAVAMSCRVSASTAALAGFLAGVASAARLQGVAWSVIVLAVVAVSTRSLSRSAFALCGWLAGSAPWWLKNLVELGQAFAPIGWHREGVASLLRDAGTARLDLGAPWLVASRLFEHLRPTASFLLPLLLAALLTLVHKRRDRRALAAAGAVLLALLVWEATGPLPRFLGVPLALLIALAAAAAGGARLSRWATGAVLATTLALGLATSVGDLHRVAGEGRLWISAERVHRAWIPDDPSRAWRKAAVDLPESARLLLVGEPRGYGCPRRFTTTSQHDVPVIREAVETLPDASAVAAWLAARGFTHLAVNWGELERLAPDYPVLPYRDASGDRRWQEFVRSLGSPVVSAGRVSIYALPAAAP